MTTRKTEQPRNAIVFTISIIAVTLILLSTIYGENPRRINSTSSRSDTAKRQKILIILTQIRSGSSFAGEIFAASNDSLYFYEPLIPFGDRCDFQEGKEALLKQLLSCDLSNLKNLYSYGFNVSKRPDSCRCMKNGFCFAKASTGLLDSYAQICNNSGTQTFDEKSKLCGYPLKPEIISKLCEAKNLIITKLTRICSMEELEKVYRHLEASQKRQVYVLHLVRDLRFVT